MSQIRSKKAKIIRDSEVLYQKLGNQWYAFTCLDGETFMSRVDDKTIADKKGEHEDEIFMEALERFSSLKGHGRSV